MPTAYQAGFVVGSLHLFRDQPQTRLHTAVGYRSPTLGRVWNGHAWSLQRPDSRSAPRRSGNRRGQWDIVSVILQTHGCCNRRAEGGGEGERVDVRIEVSKILIIEQVDRGAECIIKLGHCPVQIQKQT